ncbi:MAG: hypothetical protein LBH73_07080 [Spirochaetaceae bacterium]|nr:hypothetical protein [Spirochaetaceae bacterium]
MFGFLVKKSFFDLWDNLFKSAFINIGFIFSLAWPLLFPFLFEGVPALFWAALVSGVIWCFVYLSAASWALKAVSDYGNFGFKDFIAALKNTALDGVIAGGLAVLFCLLGVYGIPFYLSIDSPLGVIPAALVFWTLVVMLLALQFYFPVRNRLGRKPLTIIKKCFLIFLDNPGFSIALCITSLCIFLFSLVSILLFPGPAGLLLFHDEALRLRLLKYDWLEENPEKGRKVPWAALLIDEREKTGTRSLKNFIFPWKD